MLRGCRRPAIVVMLISIVFPAGTLASRSPAALEGITTPALVSATAVRGPQVVLRPPPPTPPPEPPYPTGACDSLAPGLPGLAGSGGAGAYHTIGTSVQGRLIVAEYWGPADASKLVVVVGQIHGNECSPTLFSEGVRRRSPSSGIGIWLIPTINPDGYAAHTRQNANKVDLNADGGAFSQPETRALRDFIALVEPVLTIHIHSPNGFVGTWPSRPATSAHGICRSIAVDAGLRCAGSSGSRSERSRWFVWQGLQDLGGESLLIELHAVSDAEVPFARPRPATSSVGAISTEVEQILAVLERSIPR
jgi:hypothetical protein